MKELNAQEKYNLVRIRIKTLSNDICNRKVGDHNLIESEIQVLKSSARRAREEARVLKQELKKPVNKKPLMYLWRFKYNFTNIRIAIIKENSDLLDFESNLDNLIRNYSMTLNNASKFTSSVEGLNYKLYYRVKDNQLFIMVNRKGNGFKKQTYFVC